MKIPPGMSKEEVIQTIDEISSRYCEKFKFGYYTAEDIKQEAFIIGIDGLERYDGSGPLENFLAVHIRNRLIDFKRDNYHRREDTMSEKGMILNEKKRALMHPINISRVSDEEESNMQTSIDLEKLDDKILLEHIDGQVSAEYREDYLRLKHGYKLPKIRHNIIINHIKDIVSKYDG